MDDGALGVVGNGNPVTDCWALDSGEFVAETAGELPEPRPTAEKVIDTSSIGGDPGRNEIRAGAFEVRELRCEKRSESEICKFTFERNQRLAPV
jgi:hypothetical protein